MNESSIGVSTGCCGAAPLLGQESTISYSSLLAAIGSQKKCEEQLGIKDVKFFTIPDLREYPFDFPLHRQSKRSPKYRDGLRLIFSYRLGRVAKLYKLVGHLFQSPREFFLRWLFAHKHAQWPNESSSPTAGGGSGGAQPKGTNEK